MEERVSKFISGLTDDDKQGIRDIHNLTISMCIHSIINFFKEYVQRSNVEDKELFLQRLEAKLNGYEVGCMEVKFHNGTVPNIAYLYLDLTEINHDLTHELNKIKNFILPEKWKDILKSLSTMIFIIRTVYKQVYNEFIDIVHAVCPSIDFSDLKVDISNTTLYVEDTFPVRIGIFIRYVQSQ